MYDASVASGMGWESRTVVGLRRGGTVGHDTRS